MASAAEDAPNILLMMVDDLGFADFGCYGSEIQTPRIDRLAGQGLRFTQFYNTAKCHSSRVSLLSGLYCFQAGDQHLSRATTIAEVLQNAGYFTSMSGKWHLSKEPTDFGFMRYWGHLSGATDFFTGDDTFRLNGEPWSAFDEDFYTTDANVDYAMEFISEALEADKPFFHYIAFNAPHYPLQAPKEEIEKYIGRYDAGWEVIRRSRFEKQKNLGIFPEDSELPPMPTHVPAWESLTDKQRAMESYRMAVYAAMVDRVDQGIGRVIDFLKKNGELDNTLIILCSDNGGCPFERSENIHIPPWESGSFYTYDGSWATVSNTPLRHFKQTQHEGGITSPLLIYWKGKIHRPGSWERSPGHLIDIMATCIDVTEATYPQDSHVEPLAGRSLVPFFSGKSRPGDNEFFFEFWSCRAIRQEDWKAVSFYGHKWELYNLATDRMEQFDLADTHPERTLALADRWHELAAGPYHVPEENAQPVNASPSPHTKKIWHKPSAMDSWEMPEH